MMNSFAWWRGICPGAFYKIVWITATTTTYLILISKSRDMDSLALYLSSDQINAFGDDMLKLTLAHARDQEKFEDCILEIGAFVRGGLPGMERLDKVYHQIMRHYGVASDIGEVFDALNLHIYNDKIKRKKREQEEGCFEEEEDEDNDRTSTKKKKKTIK